MKSKVFGNLAEKMDDALWVLSGVPGYISLSVKSSIKCRKALKEEARANKEEKAMANDTDFKEVDDEDVADFKNEKSNTKKEIKKALSSINYSSFEGTNIGKRISEISEGNEALRLILVARATNTSKWIQYALYYLSDSNAKLVAVNNDKTKEFLNGIAVLFGFDKMYESADIMDLKSCDPNLKEYSTMNPYILSIEALKEKANPYLAQMEQRKEQFKAEMEHPEDDKPEDFSNIPNFVEKTGEDNIIHPIFFKPEEAKEKEWVKQGNGIDDNLFKNLEDNFAGFLTEYNYRYEMAETGLINLFVERNIGFGSSIQDIYTIDPGIVMGKNKFYILAKIPNDTIFVSTEHKDIVSKVLNQKFYTLYPNEIQEVAMDYFYNNNIYRYVDMSNTEFLEKIDKESFQILGKKLTFIINQLKAMNDGISDIPRFRFDSFESIDKFSIVSDEKVISPLEATGETSSEITSGLKFEVEKSNVIQKLNDLSINYKIDKYGEI